MTDSDYLLEVCVDNLESIANAIAGGAKRIELCSALTEGGLTPTPGFAKKAKVCSSVPIFAMIRARAGDFVYSQEEFEIMIDDLKLLKSIGVDGFVFGALSDSKEINTSYCKKIVEAADPLPVTFHRAFDEVANPLSALDTIVELGFKRILTSGQEESAEKGANLIAKLIERANDQIIVMPGAGINERNIGIVKDLTRAKEFHGSAKRKGDNVKGGITITDDNIVRRMLLILNESVAK